MTYIANIGLIYSFLMGKCVQKLQYFLNCNNKKNTIFINQSNYQVQEK